jgi:hypothetical protein
LRDGGRPNNQCAEQSKKDAWAYPAQMD